MNYILIFGAIYTQVICRDTIEKAPDPGYTIASQYLTLLYTTSTYERHGHDGRVLGGKYDVPEGATLVHYLLNHVPVGYLDGHCDRRGGVGGHHGHSHRACNNK